MVVGPWPIGVVEVVEMVVIPTPGDWVRGRFEGRLLDGLDPARPRRVSCSPRRASDDPSMPGPQTR